MIFNHKGEAMYICNCCKAQFNEPVEIREIHYECVELPYESFYQCPLCESDEIEEDNL